MVGTPVTVHWLKTVKLDQSLPTLQKQLNAAFKDVVFERCSCNGETQCKAYDGCDPYSACPDNPHIEGDTRPHHPT